MSNTINHKVGDIFIIPSYLKSHDEVDGKVNFNVVSLDKLKSIPCKITGVTCDRIFVTNELFGRDFYLRFGWMILCDHCKKFDCPTVS